MRVARAEKTLNVIVVPAVAALYVRRWLFGSKLRGR